MKINHTQSWYLVVVLLIVHVLWRFDAEMQRPSDDVYDAFCYMSDQLIAAIKNNISVCVSAHEGVCYHFNTHPVAAIIPSQFQLAMY